MKCKVTGEDHFSDINMINEALKVNVSYKISTIMKKLNDSNAKNIKRKDFTNKFNGSDVADVSKTHINYMTFLIFKMRVEDGSIKCPNNLRNMQNLCKLFGLSIL